MKSKASYRERLKEIIDLSCDIFCRKVEEGMIDIPNEASFQLQLGAIMKMVGQLFEFNTKDRFIINLETSKEIESTIKSAKGLARCDIELCFYYGATCKAKALIELKHFRKDKNEAVTDNRFSLFMDLGNLEMYKKVETSSTICCAMVLTDNVNYSKPDTNSKINIGEGITSPKTIVYTSNKTITLDNEYTFHWDSYSEKCHFLKVMF